MQPNRRRSRFDAPQPKYQSHMRQIFVQNQPEQEELPNLPGPIMRNIWREEEIQRAREQIEQKLQRSHMIDKLVAEQRQIREKTLGNQELSSMNLMHSPINSPINLPIAPKRGILRNYTSQSSQDYNSTQASTNSPSTSLGSNYSNGNNKSYITNTSQLFPLVDYSSDEGEEKERRIRRHTNEKDVEDHRHNRKYRDVEDHERYNRKYMDKKEVEDHESEVEDLGVMKELKKVLAAVSERSIFSSKDVEQTTSKQEPKYSTANAPTSQYENIKWDISEEEISIRNKPRLKNQLQGPRIKFQIQAMKEETLQSKLKSIKQPQPPKVENKLTQQSSTILNRIRQNKWDAIESKKTTEVQKLIQENKSTSFEFQTYNTDEWKMFLDNKAKLDQQDATTLKAQYAQAIPTPFLNNPTVQLQNNYPASYDQSLQFQNTFPANQMHSFDLQNNFYLNQMQSYQPQNHFSTNGPYYDTQNTIYLNPIEQLQIQSHLYANQMQPHMYNTTEFNTANEYQVPWNETESTFPLMNQVQFNQSQNNLNINSTKQNKWSNKNSKYSEECQVKPLDHNSFTSVNTFNVKSNNQSLQNNNSSKSDTQSKKQEICTSKSTPKDEVPSKKSNNYYQQKYCFDIKDKSQSSSQSNQQSPKFEDRSKKNSSTGSKPSNDKEEEYTFIKPQNPPTKKQSSELKSSQTNPIKITGNTTLQNNNAQKPIKSILKNSSKSQGIQSKPTEENKVTKIESHYTGDKDRSPKSSQIQDSKSSQEIISTSSLKSNDKSTETKSSTSSVKSIANVKSTEFRPSMSPVKPVTNVKSAETKSTSLLKSNMNEKSVAIKSSMSSIKSVTYNKLAEIKSTSSLKSNTNNKLEATKLKSSTEAKTIMKDTSKVAQTFDENLLKAIHNIKPLKIMVERLDITKIKSSLQKNAYKSVKRIESNSIQVNATTNNNLKNREESKSPAATSNVKIVSVEIKSQENQPKITKEKEIELIDLSCTNTDTRIVSHQKKHAIKLNLKPKVLRNVKCTISNNNKETNFERIQQKSTQETKIEVEKKNDPKVKENESKFKEEKEYKSDTTQKISNVNYKPQEMKPSRESENVGSSKPAENTESKPKRAKITPIVWDSPKETLQATELKSNEENKSIKRRIEPIKWGADNSLAAKKVKIREVNNISTKEEVQLKITLKNESAVTDSSSSISDKFSQMSHRSQEKESTVEPDKKEQVEVNDDIQNYIAQGTIFGNLKPIPTDDIIDPPAHVCYKCWKTGHTHSKCLKPKYRKFCFNCGRLFVNLYTCPRCKEEHEKYLEKKKHPKQQESKFKDRLGDYVDESRSTPKCKERLGDYVHDEEDLVVQKLKDRLGNYIDDDLNLRGNSNASHPMYRERLEKTHQSNYQVNSPSRPSQPYNQQQQPFNRNKSSYPNTQYNRPTYTKANKFANDYQSQPHTSRSRSPVRRSRSPNTEALLSSINLKDIGPSFVNELVSLLNNLRDRSPETRNTFLNIAIDEFKNKRENRLFRD